MTKLPSPILITGAARSGTSMIAAIINICGAFGGQMSGPTRNNQKGMFENAEIRNQILKPFLGNLGLDRMGQYPLPDINKLPIPGDWKKRVEAVMVKQGYTTGPWMYKGAKACLTWPVWHNAFPEAKWVIVRRLKEDIVSSCLRTRFMRAFASKQFRDCIGVSTELDGWIWWVQQHEKRFIEMNQAGLNVRLVWPDKMVKGDFSEAKSVVKWLGLPWNNRKIRQFIDPQLWTSTKDVCPECGTGKKILEYKGKISNVMTCSSKCAEVR